MVFEEKVTAKIQTQMSDSTNTITVDGVTTEVTSPEDAKAQIDKILAIVGRSVSTNGMKLIITKEAV